MWPRVALTFDNWLNWLGNSVPVDFLHPNCWVTHTKGYFFSILMNKYTYIKMYIITKSISCRFIICLDVTSFLKPYEKKKCRRQITYGNRTLISKTTNFLKSKG